MFNKISLRVTNRLLKRELITQEDYEIYLFGVEQMLVLLLDLLTCVLVGVVFGNILQTILFVAAFAGVRVYAGGYHASTPWSCYLLTTGMIIVSTVILKYIDWNVGVLIGLLVVASLVILKFAPVDTENKPIDDVEYVYFRKKTKLVLLVEIILAVLGVVFQLKITAESIVWALAVLAVALVCEKLKKQMKKETEEQENNEKV